MSLMRLEVWLHDGDTAEPFRRMRYEIGAAVPRRGEMIRTGLGPQTRMWVVDNVVWDLDTPESGYGRLNLLLSPAQEIDATPEPEHRGAAVVTLGPGKYDGTTPEFRQYASLEAIQHQLERATRARDRWDRHVQGLTQLKAEREGRQSTEEPA